jgi:hypothetical protein
LRQGPDPIEAMIPRHMGVRLIGFCEIAENASVDHYQIGPCAQMTFWDHFTRSLLGQEPPPEWVPR